MSMRRPCLVDDWKRAHQWASMQLVAVGLAIQGTYMALPDAMRAELPQEYVRWSAIATFILIALGRIVKQDDAPRPPQ